MKEIILAVLDVIFAILKFSFFVCVCIVAFKEVRREWTPHKKVSLLWVVICIGLFYPVAQSFYDVIRPVVSSGKINLEKKDFSYDYESKQYRVTFEKFKNIDDVDVFYTAYYDDKGNHTGRMAWIKYIDYRFDENWIQSRHELGYAEGKHTIVLKYRTWFWNYPTAKRQAEESLSD